MPASSYSPRESASAPSVRRARRRYGPSPPASEVSAAAPACSSLRLVEPQERRAQAGGVAEQRIDRGVAGDRVESGDRRLRVGGGLVAGLGHLGEDPVAAGRLGARAWRGRRSPRRACRPRRPRSPPGTGRRPPARPFPSRTASSGSRPRPARSGPPRRGSGSDAFSRTPPPCRAGPPRRLPERYLPFRFNSGCASPRFAGARGSLRGRPNIRGRGKRAGPGLSGLRGGSLPPRSKPSFHPGDDRSGEGHRRLAGAAGRGSERKA